MLFNVIVCTKIGEESLALGHERFLKFLTNYYFK